MRGRERPGGRQQGIALVLVLWVVVLLSILAAEFIFLMRSEVKTATYSKEHLQAYYLAQAGFQAGLRELMLAYDLNGSSGGGDLLFFHKGEARGSSEEPIEGVAPSAPNRSGIPLGPGYFSYRIVDEDGKFNINSVRRKAPKSQQNSAYQQLRNIFVASGVSEGADLDMIMDSILDWRDANDEHRLNGAETEWYEQNYEEKGLSQPYRSKNGPFDTVEELLLVRGITPEILYGSDMVRGMSTLGATPTSEEEDRLLGVASHLTVFSNYQVNENTASPFLLGAVMPDRVENILTAREEKGFSRRGKTSTTFSIEATGYLRRGPVSHTVRGVVRRVSPSAKKVRLKLLLWQDRSELLGQAEPLSLEEVLELRTMRSRADTFEGIEE